MVRPRAVHGFSICLKQGKIISLLILYLVEKWRTPFSDLSGSFNWLTALWCARILNVAPELSMHFLFCFPDPCSSGAPDQGIWL